MLFVRPWRVGGILRPGNLPLAPHPPPLSSPHPRRPASNVGNKLDNTSIMLDIRPSSITITIDLMNRTRVPLSQPSNYTSDADKLICPARWLRFAILPKRCSATALLLCPRLCFPMKNARSRYRNVCLLFGSKHSGVFIEFDRFHEDGCKKILRDSRMLYKDLFIYTRDLVLSVF